MNESMPLLSIKGLKTEFRLKDGRYLRAVDGIDLDMKSGEIHGLVGESGCGKTVASLSILRLITPPGVISGGKVLWNGRNLLEMGYRDIRNVRGKEIAMVFQNPQGALNPLYTIGEQMKAIIKLHRPTSRHQVHDEIINLLRIVKLPEPEKRIHDYPHQLSGGMCQRVMIAMALSCRPQLLIADEPTASLDVTIQAQIMDLLLDLRDQFKMAILLISHDMGVVARLCDRISVMYLGKIVEESEADALYLSPRHPYTQALLKAVPIPDPMKKTKFVLLKGDMPGSVDIPSGCRFRSRCPVVFEKCIQEPPLNPVSENGPNVACLLYETPLASQTKSTITIHPSAFRLFMKPIEVWNELVNSSDRKEELYLSLKDVYRNRRAFIAAIIMNSRCPGRCLHCIYAPDYDQYNKNMSWEEWKIAFQFINDKLGLKRFIFDGRAVTEECIRAIRLLKKDYPSTKVGLIADGVSLEPYVGELIECPPDWLDVSVDGLEKDHDTQRNHPGAYKTTINTLTRLKESAAFEKLSILTCLTTMNIKSVTGMVRQLNAQGFKNFFITPVGIMKGYRPNPGLQPKKEDFIVWLDELMEMTTELSDSWVEVDIYDAIYAAAIKQLRPDLFQEFTMDCEHLEIMRNSGDNEVHINYYPASLSGIRELIVNSNGDVIPPKVMAMGKIPCDLVMSRVVSHSQRGIALDSTNWDNVLAMYFDELLEEKQLLGHAPCLHPNQNDKGGGYAHT